MAAKNVTAERLPGMPGPSTTAIERQERFLRAMEELNDVISEMMEGLPTRNSAHSGRNHGEKIKGNHLQITWQPRK